VGGAYEIWRFGRFIATAYRKLRYHLDTFLKTVSSTGEPGSSRLSHVVRDEFLLNYRHNNDWFCPGSMARSASNCCDLQTFCLM